MREGRRARAAALAQGEAGRPRGEHQGGRVARHDHRREPEGRRRRAAQVVHVRLRLRRGHAAEGPVRQGGRAGGERGAPGLQRDGVRVRPDRRGQVAHDGGLPRPARAARDHPQLVRAHLRGGRQGGREHAVPRARVVPRDLQRGDPRPAREGPEEPARAQGERRLGRVRQGPHELRRQVDARDRPGDAGGQEEPLGRLDAHEPDELALALHLHHRRRVLRDERPRRAHPRRQAQPRRPRRLGAPVQDGRDRRPAQGGDQDQPEPLGARQRHLGARRRQVAAHPVPRLQAHAPAPGSFGPARGRARARARSGEGRGWGRRQRRRTRERERG